MVGLTCDQTPAQWSHEIATAMEAGIDGFALNIGPSDCWTTVQLDYAYSIAEQARDFVVFISFDMAAETWPPSQVAELINRYRQSSAQMLVNGRPLVSTFEGTDWAHYWPKVREQTCDIFLVSDWSSLGPHGVGQKLDLIDGAFSWDAWPRAGCTKMTPAEDLFYRENLRGKKYMMGISPWFYTNLPQWNKDWHCSSESLWYDRCQQVLEIMPDFVQIITWNDFGESSYICDVVPSQVVNGAEQYVVGHSHSAFRAVLPYLTAAYKAGSTETTLPREDIAIAWYRTAPARAVQQHVSSTVWGQGGSVPAAYGIRDVVSVVTLTRGAASVTVTIGEFRKMTLETQKREPIVYFEVPYGSHATGPVTITLNDRTTTRPAITDGSDCWKASLNAVAIQVRGSSARGANV
ncbi:Glycoside hydrolase [Madurella fahalii]|uniref:Glycoside hydrolase n=1 Tax=Madurella fahalii TaxID=1157608 RepID=A0ABQ0GEM5_9PEZI